ncbi:unnamed protein product [Ceratitis capitata]|uniref:(Mediterranean fruit fly) hypothetical protein n=1 Tax=Ceratitis capitata TaxID=7213 RepID=A0A811U3A5_CERCA|nr:unnamed protein product [Ceratitis capitata]
MQCASIAADREQWQRKNVATYNQLLIYLYVYTYILCTIVVELCVFIKNICGMWRSVNGVQPTLAGIMFVKLTHNNFNTKLFNLLSSQISLVKAFIHEKNFLFEIPYR